jgi:hypothetical protein
MAPSPFIFLSFESQIIKYGGSVEKGEEGKENNSSSICSKDQMRFGSETDFFLTFFNIQPSTHNPKTSKNPEKPPKTTKQQNN